MRAILRLGLDDHVKMIVLDGVFNQPKVAALTPLGEGLPYFHYE